MQLVRIDKTIYLAKEVDGNSVAVDAMKVNGAAIDLGLFVQYVQTENLNEL